MRIFIATLALIGLALPLTAQLQFQKVYDWSYDNIGYSLETTADGYLLLGSTKTAANQRDILLIKTDLNGDTLWTNTYGGVENEVGYSVKKTSDNGCIIAGYTESFGAGQADVYLIKVDIGGAEEWSQTFGGSNTDIAYVVEQMPDKGFIISGFTKSFGDGLEDTYLIRTDSVGNLMWDNPYGSSCREIAYAITETSNNDLMMAGITTGEGGTAWMIYVVKVSSTGALLWRRSYDFSMHISNKLRYSYSIIENSIQEYVITGSVGMGIIGDAQPFILHLDVSGLINSSHVYSWNSGDCTGYSILQTSDGGYIVGGTMGNYYPTMMKVDNTNIAEWTMQYSSGGSSTGQGYSVKITDDGGYALLGYNVTAGDTSTYFIKTDALGNSGSANESATTGMGTTWSHTSSINTNDPFCISSGIDEVARSWNYSIYPNPLVSTAMIDFQNPNMAEHTLVLYDIRQRIVQTIPNITGSQVVINRGGLESGLYFFQISRGWQIQVTGKLMVE